MTLMEDAPARDRGQRSCPQLPAYFEVPMFRDERGWFTVMWNGGIADEMLGCRPNFVQDNHSRSKAAVLRGMHYQVGVNAQAKLVRVTTGVVFDVVVDIRRSSETFGQWSGFELDSAVAHHLWIPVGYAHGFLSLANNTELQYRVTAPYEAEAERSIAWNDPDVGIAWPDVGMDPMLSQKDAEAPFLRDAEIFE